MKRIESRSARLAVIVTACTSPAVGWQGSMRQLAGQGSPGPTSVLSQLSGAVMTLLPQIVQKFVQPSSSFVLPSSHSAPASTWSLPQSGGSVDDEDVLGVVVEDVVVGTGPLVLVVLAGALVVLVVGTTVLL